MRARVCRSLIIVSHHITYHVIVIVTYLAGTDEGPQGSRHRGRPGAGDASVRADTCGRFIGRRVGALQGTQGDVLELIK